MSRRLVASLLFVLGASGPSAVAVAQPAAAPAAAPASAPADVERSNQAAVENIDLGDFEAARGKLVEALAQLEAAGLGAQPAAARTHMLLGLVYAQGVKDAGRGEKHMVRAHELDAAVALDGHADEASRALWAKAQQAVNPTIDCATLEGIAHRRLTSAAMGEPVKVSAKLGKELFAGPASLHVRGPGERAFAEIPMTREGDCDVAGVVPFAAATPPGFDYHVVVATAAGKTAAAAGSAKKPIHVDVVGAAQVAAESEARVERQEEEVPDQIQVGKGKGGSCAGCASAPGAADGIALGLAFLGLAAVRRRRARG